MAFNVANAIVRFTPDMKPLTGVAGKIQSTVQGLTSKISAATGLSAGAVAGLAVAGVAAIGAVVAKGISAFREQEQAERKLQAVLKATGGAAGFTAKQLFKHAAGLQKITEYGDEAIINTQALLATFKQIQGDVFTRTTQAVLDLSAAMGQDLKSSAVQVGKALNDPMTGVSALQRVGVSFTETQKEMIKNFVETNQLARAQGIILQELESEFGGTAEEMASSFSGQMTQLKNIVGDLFEGIGAVVAPILAPLVAFLKPVVDAIGRLLKAIGSLISPAQEVQASFAGAFGEVVVKPINMISAAIETVAEVLHSLKQFLAPLGAAFKAVFEAPIQLLTTFLKALGIDLPGALGNAQSNMQNWIDRITLLFAKATLEIIKMLEYLAVTQEAQEKVFEQGMKVVNMIGDLELKMRRGDKKAGAAGNSLLDVAESGSAFRSIIETGEQMFRRVQTSALSSIQERQIDATKENTKAIQENTRTMQRDQTTKPQSSYDQAKDAVAKYGVMIGV